MAQPVIDGLLSLDNPVLRSYFFYSSILVTKMIFMSFYTGRTRFKTKTFANVEDAKKIGKVGVNDEVERVRRAHLNDLENIPIFFVSGFIYAMTDPSVALATWLFRIFTAARIAHTVVYAVYVLPQPARGISFGLGVLTVGFMAVKSAFYFY